MTDAQRQQQVFDASFVLQLLVPKANQQIVQLLKAFELWQGIPLELILQALAYKPADLRAATRVGYYQRGQVDFRKQVEVLATGGFLQELIESVKHDSFD